ncbi:hypothetical protein R1sor_007041 [Riccia sorocarpa]|uniref:CS domain-containing protein n=1 Tax=Riccia sorocarpa TaxID=122646 RepID=A0ABD3HP98_9MARC
MGETCTLRHPEVVWAQRSDKVFLTVELPDALNPNVKLQPEGKFTFSSMAPCGNRHELDLELFGRVNVGASKINVGLRHIFVVLQKEDNKWWNRLLKPDRKTPPYIKVDWNKWVDEDEEHEAPTYYSFDVDDFAKYGTDAENSSSEVDEGATLVEHIEEFLLCVYVPLSCVNHLSVLLLG